MTKLCSVPDDRPVSCGWGDGSEFTTAEVHELRRLYGASAVSVPWERGDILLCDNLRTSHGRAAFEGERSVVAMLGGRLRRCGDRSVELITG